MARLVLIDTADELPGLMPLHAWSALMTSELVVLGQDDHPFAPHLEAAELRVEIVPGSASAKPLTRVDLLSGLSPELKGRAEWVVDRAREVGEVAYLHSGADSEAFTRTLGMEAARAQVEVEVVFFGAKPRGSKLLRLVQVMERLRSDEGCPWDAEQDHASLAPYASEEVFELLDAIASEDTAHITEELGDVLLQVVFHAQIGADDGTFDIDAVAEQISDKLVRRHPHVFGDVSADTAEQVSVNWEAIKAAEKPERAGPFDGLATSQPGVALMAAYLKRAAKHGFLWPDDSGPVGDVRDELLEFLAAETDEARTSEVGDLLAAVVGLARWHGIDPEVALRASAQRFRARFEAVMAVAGDDPSSLTREQWLGLWDRAKAELAGESS